MSDMTSVKEISDYYIEFETDDGKGVCVKVRPRTYIESMVQLNAKVLQSIRGGLTGRYTVRDEKT